MSKGTISENEWPLESRKKVIKGLPPLVYDCLQRVVSFALKPDPKAMLTIQRDIELCIFQVSHIQKVKPLNPLIFFKALNAIAAAFIFDLKTVESRRIFFQCLFLGREPGALSDPASHQKRLDAMKAFASLAVQYPMPFFFDFLAEWFLSDDNYARRAWPIFNEICSNFLLRPAEAHKRKFVITLESTSFEFAALGALLWVDKDYFEEPHSSELISLLGEWYSKRCLDFLKFYSKYPMLAKEFASKRFPVLLEFACSNGIATENYERFHTSVLNVIMVSSKVFSQTPLDLSYIFRVKEDENLTNQKRINECIYVAQASNLIKL